MDELLLVTQSQQGQVETFNQLVLRYQNDVFNLAVRMLADPDQAEDATQNAFLSAYRHIRTFRGGSFRAWLMRIATNACYDELRRVQRRQWISLNPLNEQGEEMETPAWMVDESDSPEDVVIRRDLGRTLQACLQKLGDEARAIILMVDLLGMDYQEVAQVLGVPLGTVKSRLARARMKMRKSLTQTGEAGFPYRAAHRGISI